MDQELALAVLLSGESALLTGPAGTGKTHLLSSFIRQARANGKKVSVTATTGLAATHLNGNTIHSWSGMGIHDHLPQDFFDRLSKTRRDTITKTDVLIIDEISMMHDFRLDMLDQVLQGVREKEEPFGGVQVVMSGDFFQLPPINRGDSRGGGFVVYSDVWQELQPKVLYLKQQYRQSDGELLDILTALRKGDIRRRHAETLLGRMEVEPSGEGDITELHTVNIDVDSINSKKLMEIDDDEREYQQSTTGSKIYVDSLQRSVLAPNVLMLKKGALVMAVKNAVDRSYANGSIGVVVDFEPLTEYPVVQFRSGREVTMVPESWELRDGERKRASITQVPLRLAWAITVHKSQGMTLDAAKIDLRKAFVDGMGYVALSRVRDIENLYLYGINKKALSVSPDALAIDEVLVKTSQQTAKELEYLREQMKKQTARPKAKVASSSWKDKIEKMRETHPNAFKPWELKDDEQLKQDFLNGADLDALSSTFGRHKGSIVARLKKHFGDDMVA